MPISSLHYDGLHPERTILVHNGSDEDTEATSLQVRWDGEDVDLVGKSKDDEQVIAIYNIPLATMDQLAIDYLEARGVKVATVITWAFPDYNDDCEIRGHSALVEAIHVDMGWLENDTPHCPICMAELERTDGEPIYEYKHVTLNLWDEAAQDYVEKTAKVRYLMGSRAVELLPCPECGFDWAKDKDDDNRIVQHAMEWQQKERANGGGGR